MDEGQFKELVRMFDDSNKAMVNTFLSGLGAITDKVIAGMTANSKDHDLLIKIHGLLEHHESDLDRVEDKVNTHIAESGPIRDVVRTCEAHVEGCVKDEHDKKLSFCMSVAKGVIGIGSLIVAVFTSVVTALVLKVFKA